MHNGQKAKRQSPGGPEFSQEAENSMTERDGSILAWGVKSEQELLHYRLTKHATLYVLFLREEPIVIQSGPTNWSHEESHAGETNSFEGEPANCARTNRRDRISNPYS